jgi:hypothetical protein
MRTLRKYLLSKLSKLFIICPLFLIQTDQQPVDNLAILNNMAAMVSQKIVDRLSPDSSASILIRAQSQGQAGKWLIENEIAKRLFQNGVSKIYIDKYDSSSTFVIEYQILSLRVSYHPTAKNNLIERQFRLNLTVRTWEGSSGLVKFLDEYNEQHTDSVNVIDVSKFENKDFPFTQASLPEERRFNKYIESFIVMTTTAAIVYLFFRLRSN